MENEYRFNFKIECMEGHGKSICAKFQELFKQNNYRTISVEDYAFKTEPGKVVTVGALRGNFIQLLKTLDLVYGANVKSRSLYSLRHMYATFALKAGRDIQKLTLQMGTSVAMLEKFHNKVSPRINAAEHACVKKRD